MTGYGVQSYVPADGAARLAAALRGRVMPARPTPPEFDGRPQGVTDDMDLPEPLPDLVDVQEAPEPEPEPTLGELVAGDGRSVHRADGTRLGGSQSGARCR